MSRYARQPKSCEHCGKIMLVPPHAMQRKRYCSRACRGHAQGIRNLRNPTGPNQTSFKPGQNTGSANPMYVKPVELKCEHCGANFALKPWVLRQKANKGRFCSVKCCGEYRRLHESGVNNPMWVGGPKTYRGRGWLEARAKVVAEQHGACASCGVVIGASLPVHHIKPFREFTSATQANVRENLIGLCPSCHMRAEYVHTTALQSTG